MADTTTPPLPPGMPTVDTLAPLGTDAAQAVKDIQLLLATYKTGGLAGVGAKLATLVPDVEKTYADVKTALPTIKTGYATTEFWITVVVDGIIAYLTAKGTVPAIDGTTAIAALTAVYTMVRALVKNKAASATPATVATK